MASDSHPKDEAGGFPAGTTLVRQSTWAWLWTAVPWTIAGIVLVFYERSLGILAFILGAIGLIPGFFRWKNTLYILTGEHLVLQRGFMGGSQRYTIPASHFQDVKERPGLFGRYLGYQIVEVKLETGRKVRLSFVPVSARLAPVLKEMMAARVRRPAEQDSDAVGHKGG